MPVKKKVAVVIPIYEAQPEANEVAVLHYFLRLYAAYPIIFMAQDDLDLHLYEQAIRESGHTEASFERFSWKGYQQYINLLVSADYYARFLDYEYILLVHLDAFAFNADLDRWCALGYDYIGAVIYNQRFIKEYIASSRLLRTLNLLGGLRRYPVQNGGFSLRKVESFYQNCRRFAKLIKRTGIVYTEDLFWSLRLPLINPFFRVAPTRIACEFAVELPVTKSDDFESVANKLHVLPMGCHGWKVFGFPFWKKYMEQAMKAKMEEAEYPER